MICEVGEFVKLDRGTSREVGRRFEVGFFTQVLGSYILINPISNIYKYIYKKEDMNIRLKNKECMGVLGNA